MKPAEELDPSSPPQGSSRRTAILLVLLVAGLFAATYFSLRGSGPKNSDDAARLTLETTVEARELFALRQSGSRPDTVSSTSKRLIGKLTTLADKTRSPKVIRRLALIQYTVGDPSWKASLGMLRETPTFKDPAAVERELSMWREALAGRLLRGRVEELERQITALDLGWYRFIALKAMYENAGMDAEAAQAAQQAVAASSPLILLMALGALAAAVGLGLGLGLLSFLRWRARDPDAPLPPRWRKLMQITPPHPLPRSRANALYSMFLAYLVAFAAVRLLMATVIRPLLLPTLLRMGSAAVAGVSILLTCLPLIAPYLLFRRARHISGLRGEDLGFTTRSVGIDILWGIAGYMMALPLVGIANALSQRLFHGLETPLNPAITQFASSRNGLFQALLFLQAALIAPVTEEVMFRGIFFRSLEARAGVFSAAIIASATFAVLHPQLPLGFLGIFVLGLMFTLLYRLRGSLLPGTVMHAVNNGMIFLMLTLLLDD